MICDSCDNITKKTTYGHLNTCFRHIKMQSHNGMCVASNTKLKQTTKPLQVLHHDPLCIIEKMIVHSDLSSYTWILCQTYISSIRAMAIINWILFKWQKTLDR